MQNGFTITVGAQYDVPFLMCALERNEKGILRVLPITTHVVVGT
ncbi:MAG: hypothetical protein AAFR56_06755 [Chloroflexota bacterium]